MPEQLKISLYDLPTTLKEKALLVFPFRLRLLLDYKNIPYETIWIDFPDLEATAKAVGAPPTAVNADGSPGYTFPFITIASLGKPTIVLAGSVQIAEYMEDVFPGRVPSLLPKETRVFQAVFTKYLTEKVLSTVFTTILPQLVDVMPTLSRQWLIESRKRITGRSWEELVPQNEASMAKAWKIFDAAFDDLAAHLDKAGEGNNRITGGVSYAEFELVSILNLIKRVSPDVAWKRLEVRSGGRWKKLIDLPLYTQLLPANRVGALL